MKYRVHRFAIKMTRDHAKLEQFLNNLEGEVVAIIPNVTIMVMWIPKVDFLLFIIVGSITGGAVLFRGGGFLAALLFRYGFYLMWHILWAGGIGVVRYWL